MQRIIVAADQGPANNWRTIYQQSVMSEDPDTSEHEKATLFFAYEEPGGDFLDRFSQIKASGIHHACVERAGLEITAAAVQSHHNARSGTGCLRHGLRRSSHSPGSLRFKP